MEQFAYVASHDVQEPLRKIQTFTELIRTNYEDGDMPQIPDGVSIQSF